MNCPKRALIKGQQAASGEVKQASLLVPVQTASKMAQRRIGGIIQTRRANPTSVSAAFAGVEKRLARIQASVPVERRGAGRIGSSSART
jgi:hypothetical protein